MQGSAKRAITLFPKALQGFDVSKPLAIPKDGVVFRQGDRADALFYVISGRIRYSVSRPDGKDAMLFVFGEGDIFGERCFDPRGRRFGTACALTDATLVRIPCKEVQSRLLTDAQLGKFLLDKMLDRAHEYEEVLVLQLLDNTERRLASMLLRLAGFYTSRHKAFRVIEGISQSQLADMVGTTRPRVNGFMTRFRRLGLITYADDRITVNRSLADVVAYRRT